MKKTYKCKCCDNKNIIFSAEAKWDIDKQEFVYNIEKFYFDDKTAFCEVCDTWTDFDEDEE